MPFNELPICYTIGRVTPRNWITNRKLVLKTFLRICQNSDRSETFQRMVGYVTVGIFLDF